MTSSVGGGGRYMAFSPSPSAPHSPHLSGLRSAAIAAARLDQEKYLSELLEERYKLTPFLSVIPHTCRLLNQEISRITTLLGNASVLGQSGLEQASPLTSGGMFSNGRADVNRLISRFQSKIPGSMQPSLTENWLNSQGSSSGLLLREQSEWIPVDKYPNKRSGLSWGPFFWHYRTVDCTLFNAPAEQTIDALEAFPGSVFKWSELPGLDPLCLSPLFLFLSLSSMYDR
ncbi:KH domain-containing protein At5g56140-like [Hibiscus syriacus]|uniref:KH domain-containing protein At5g56140-like n=1 Tax=Hibiscus syriacus TaxID=106335 RepID=UPI001922ED25|nr:KH domain-containing protein At5g56140-like [Hibiscus syriacus]